MMCKHDVASSPTIPNHGEIEMPACRSPRLHDRDTAGHVAQALRQASQGGILLYAPVLDRHLEAMAAPTGSSASMICRGRPTAKAEASRRRWQARPPRFS